MAIETLTPQGDKQIVGLHTAAVGVHTPNQPMPIAHQSTAGQPLVQLREAEIHGGSAHANPRRCNANNTWSLSEKGRR